MVDHLIFDHNKWFKETISRPTIRFGKNSTSTYSGGMTYVQCGENVRQTSSKNFCRLESRYSKWTNWLDGYNDASGMLVAIATMNFDDIGPTKVYVFLNYQDALTYTYVRASDAKIISGGYKALLSHIYQVFREFITRKVVIAW